MYLDYLAVEDIHFQAYIDHRETRLFDNISFYSGRLACGSRLVYPNLYERVMRQFDCMLFVPKDPSDYAISAMTHKDIYAMYDDFVNHLVPDKAQSIIAPRG